MIFVIILSDLTPTCRHVIKAYSLYPNSVDMGVKPGRFFKDVRHNTCV